MKISNNVNIYEIVRNKNDVPYIMFFQQGGAFPRHCHESIEIFMILSGELELEYVGNYYLLKTKDVILINSNELHEIIASSGFFLVLQIPLELFWSYSENNLFFECNSTESKEDTRFDAIRRVLAKLVNNHSDDRRNNFMSLSLLYQLMHILTTNFQLESSDSQKLNSKKADRLQSILSYINEHYRERITLKDVAEREFLSPTYLSSYFEKNMGVTFTKFIAYSRVDYAISELLYTNKTIENIAMLSGFPNSRSFVSAFRDRYNMTPSEYRKKNISLKTAFSTNERSFSLLDRIEFDGVLNEYLNEQQPDRIEDTTIPKVLDFSAIDATKTKASFRHTFKSMIGIGKARDLLDTNIQEMLIKLQKDIGFEHIKFHGLLDDSMSIYREVDGKVKLSFLYIDKLLDFTLSVGLKPLMQLGFMPTDLAKLPISKASESRFVISEPKSMAKWEYLVTKLVEHLIFRYGKKEVEGWLFTFWNIPISNTPFSLRSNVEAVHRLYAATRTCLKNISENIKYACPSFILTDCTKESFSQFMALCESSNTLPDILLFHFYPVIENSENKSYTATSALSNNPRFMRESLSLAMKQIRRFEDIPVHISEWNSTTCHRDLLNDTCFKAAYIVKNMIDNHDHAEGFGYWCMTDMIEEFQLEEKLFHGGLGLFTYNGIKKPSYYAFVFLASLGCFLVEKGSNYIATRNENGEIILLFHNYHHYNRFYAKGLQFSISKKQRTNVFVNPRTLKCNITLSNLQHGKYTVYETWVNQHSGCSFDKWLAAGTPNFMSPEHVEALDRLSSPMQHFDEIDIKENSFQLEAVLEPHEIRLIRLTRIPNDDFAQSGDIGM